MKKFVMTLAAVLCCTISMEAQILTAKSKMSSWLQDKYEQHQTAVKKNGGPLRAKGRIVRKYILTLVQSTDEAQSIREKGGVVLQPFNDGICAAFLPVDSLEALNESPAILRMEANEPASLKNDTSAVIIGVDKAWAGQSSGTQLPQAFTGKGVVAGVMDVGFDFTHPSFRNDDGTSRIKWFWDPMTSNANNDTFGMIFASPTEVLAAQHSSDAYEEDHGTHVLGSMAGRGLNGRYVGMAPEADIMGALVPLGGTPNWWLKSFNEFILKHLGGLSDMEDVILQIESSNVPELVELYKIFEQADAAGQPCVVNWSFGAPNNFNDNTLYEQVFNSLVGPGRIVVTSAGNNGGTKTYVKKEADIPLEQFVSYATTGEKYNLSLAADINNPYFRVGLKFWNVADTLFFDTRDVLAAINNGQKYTTETSAMKLEVQADLVSYGRVGFMVKLTPQGDYKEAITKEGGGATWLVTEGKIIIDTPIEVHLLSLFNANDQVCFSKDYITNSRGCNQGTIGYPAAIERIIAVGAMHHRSSITNILGKTNSTHYAIGSQEGNLVAFSSCGPTLDGRIKPDVVAPGYNIISALNYFYFLNADQQTYDEDIIPLTTYYDNVFGNPYAMWAMSGTSMSSPIAAGVIALWLQAKPDLTPEDILGVIERTSHQPEPEFSGTDKNVYYGWGEIDAYAGLLDILGINTSIPELSKHQPAGIKFRVVDNIVYIDGLDNATAVTVYDLNGRPVLKTVCDNGSINLSGFAAGVYAVQVGNLGSTLIRL